jgi:hypothetical protein
MKEIYTKAEQCRVCSSQSMTSVLNLGVQALTGVFPKTVEEKTPEGPVELVWCSDCGLLQMAYSYAPDEMYGDNYGYRSGLNASMVKHLTNKVRYLQRIVTLDSNSVVLDIGSNDATSLKAYQVEGLRKIGIDPTGGKFKKYYTDDITLVEDFFSADAFKSVETRKANIVTSIAMFYDLEDPIAFARQIEEVLDVNGVWHFEQSYMPSMLRTNSYDTICHEHLEFYSLQVVKRILSEANLKVVDVQMNAINGGSFAVTAAKKASPLVENHAVIKWLVDQEKAMGLSTPKPYRDFEERVFRHRDDLVSLIRALNADGKTVLGYGASTKGNVMLQFCGFTAEDIPAIAEVNEDKFGCFCPGTGIPIISEAEAHAMEPDYFIVLPWHFKNGIVEREREFLERGGKMIFPFPEIEII